MNKHDDMLKVQKLAFAKTEAELFLDTHPDCKCALDYYLTIVAELDGAMDEYQAKHGPIHASGTSSDRWSWVDSPWPWQLDGEIPKNGAERGGKR